MSDHTKARKTHQCEICCQAILPGEFYVNQTWAPWQCTGDMDAYLHLKACRFCYEHIVDRWDFSYGQGWTKYDLRDGLCEYSLDWHRKLVDAGLIREVPYYEWWSGIRGLLQENTPEALKRLVNIL